MSKILLDENVAIKYKCDLLNLGNDVVHINDEAKGIPDNEVFKKAITEGRILITGDDDFKDKNFKFKTAIIWITPKQFMEQYSLSKSQAYKILSRPEMQEAKIKTGEKQIRINLDRAFEIMQQIYS